MLSRRGQTPFPVQEARVPAPLRTNLANREEFGLTVEALPAPVKDIGFLSFELENWTGDKHTWE